MADLLVIIPTRSRPEAMQRVVDAWTLTDAFEQGAEPLFVYDADDPRAEDYIRAFDTIRWSELYRARFRRIPQWRPMVPKLNDAALDYAQAGEHFAIGFAGDDHMPRTYGWVREYLDSLRAMGTGIVYGDDGYQHDRLPTQWAMTADIVRALGRMVPAPVDHLYCDNAVLDLGRAADCIRYLPRVLIEHMHPVAGKAASDEQYERVNGREQFRGDRKAYREWRTHGLEQSAQIVRLLREEG